MDKSNVILFIIMAWTLLVYGGITYLIVEKKAYGLMSGFSNRSEEEQAYLIENGYVRSMEKVLVTSFWLLCITVVLLFLPIPLGFPIGLGVFIVYLLAGMVWIQRYEIPSKRKKMYWITGVLTTVIIIGTIILLFIGFKENDLKIQQDTFVVTGIYGVEWSTTEIENVQLLDELPEVKAKKNGSAIASRLKGHFKLEDPYGSGLLFINSEEAPFLYVQKHDGYLIANLSNSNETKKIYQLLIEKINY